MLRFDLLLIHLRNPFKTKRFRLFSAVFILFYQFSDLSVKFKRFTFQFGNVHERVYMYLVASIIAALTSNLLQVVPCFSPVAELQQFEI